MKQHSLRVSAMAAAFTSALGLHPAGAAVTTFETVTLPASGYLNGSAPTDDFTLAGTTFRNNYNAAFDSWSGFSFSNRTDTTTAGFLNQYSAITGGGAAGSSQYAVGYYSTFEPATTHITFGALTNLAGLGASITNTTYAALSMANGDGYAKNFGGVTGNDADWLLLTIQGYANGGLTGSVDFYLADYRFANNSLDYIVNDWRFVDFSALGIADEIRFSLTSSDNDPSFGMKTPSYFALDNFLAVPEPSSLLIALSGLGLLIRRKR